MKNDISCFWHFVLLKLLVRIAKELIACKLYLCSGYYNVVCCKVVTIARNKGRQNRLIRRKRPVAVAL